MTDSGKKKPITGFVVKNLDLKAWAGIIAAVIATGGLIYALMSGFFWTREEQTTHQADFNGHVVEFKSHEAVVRERNKSQEKMMDKVDAMNDNIIRLGEKMRVRRLRRVEEEPE
jgi:hypothetical protein